MKYNIIKTVVVATVLILAGFTYSCNRMQAIDSVSVNTNQDIATSGDSSIKDSSYSPDDNHDQADEETVAPKYWVHVCGAIEHPGVYEVSKGSRTIDAIKLAGGFLESASVDYLNLAEVTEDGMKLYVPTVEEVEQGNINENLSQSGLETKIRKLNLNTATKEELMTLNGIGEAKADAIIKYRKSNGGFEKIEDIKNISGIKDSAFDKIKDDITV